MATALPSSLEPERAGVVVSPDVTAGVAGPPPVEPGPPAPGSTSHGSVVAPRRRRVPLLIGIAALVVLIGILTTVVVNRSDGPAEPAGPTSTASLQFPTETLAFASLDRNWDVTGDVLTGSVNLTNTGSEVAKGRHIEVIPKSLASGPDQIKSDPTPSEIIDSDPILAYDVEIDPGQSTTVTYTISVPAGTDDAKLTAWKEEAATTMAAYKAEVSKVPTLVITAPADGATVDTADFILTGTTDVGATLDINGGPTAVNPDGTWSARQFGYPEGPHVYTVTATGTNEQTATLAITVNYAPPPPPVVTTPKVTTPKVTTPKPPAPVTVKPVVPSDPPPVVVPPDPIVPVSPGVTPVARADSISYTPCWTGTEFLWASIDVLKNDVVGSADSIALVTNPEDGKVVWNKGLQLYQFQPKYSGAPSYTNHFTYRLYNSVTGLSSAVVTVSITINSYQTGC